MPNWEVHVKWAKELGIDEKIASFINKLIDTPEEVLKNDPTELGNIYRTNPEQFKQIIGSHDWGRRSKAIISILRAYCKYRFSDEGVYAAELHHILDYITHIRDPRNLAGIIVSSRIFQLSGGKPIEDRILMIKNYYEREGYGSKRELEASLLALDYETYKKMIISLLERKFRDYEISEKVKNFVIENLDRIIDDIDTYLKKCGRKVARARAQLTLDKWGTSNKK